MRLRGTREVDERAVIGNSGSNFKYPISNQINRLAIVPMNVLLSMGWSASRLNKPPTLSIIAPASISIGFDFGTFVVSRVRGRRHVAADRERGVGFPFGFFDHVQINWRRQFGELSRTELGQVPRTEAVFHRFP